MTVQNSQDRTATGQTTGQTAKTKTAKPVKGLARDHADYWAGRLRKRTYTDRQGQVVVVPEWQVRLFQGGTDGWFNLGSANRAAAAVKARDIAVHLRAHGWEATEKKFKPQGEAVEWDKTIAQFGDFYREAVLRVEYPPSRHTAERYVKSLAFLCRHVGVTKIAALTPKKIQEFKAEYLAEGREEKRDDESVKVSCNAILRNASAMFSKQMLETYQGSGMTLANPFAGQKLRRVIIKAYSPLAREKLDALWRGAATLRDGNPDSAPLFSPRRKRRKAGEPKPKVVKWKKPDWAKPHPEAYLLLLLELGLGLRRHEADKAEWDWLQTREDGTHTLEVKPTRFFVPKSKERRVIPVEPALFNALSQFRGDAMPFIVPGRTPKPLGEITAKNIVYRCDVHHRVLAAWLRERGIIDDKPCHLLRKEFGSYVATSFGLFAAQRLLGHSAPDVTSRFYAGLTNLPELDNAKLLNTVGKTAQPIGTQSKQEAV